MLEGSCCGFRADGVGGRVSEIEDVGGVGIGFSSRRLAPNTIRSRVALSSLLNSLYAPCFRFDGIVAVRPMPWPYRSVIDFHIRCELRYGQDLSSAETGSDLVRVNASRVSITTALPKQTHPPHP